MAGLRASRQIPVADVLNARDMRLVVLIIALVALGGCAPSSSRSARVAQPPAVDLVDEVWRIVDEHFFDPKLNGIEWRAAGARS